MEKRETGFENKIKEIYVFEIVSELSLSCLISLGIEN